MGKKNKQTLIDELNKRYAALKRSLMVIFARNEKKNDNPLPMDRQSVHILDKRIRAYKTALNKVDKPKKSVLKPVILSVIGVIVVCGIAGVCIISPYISKAKAIAYEKLSSINENTFKFLDNTRIYNENDEQIAEIYKSNYEYIPIDQVPEYIQQGYIAVEDKRFLSHHGIDYTALARAGFSYIKNLGHITQGGSTITQQVIKNMLLTQEQTFNRKLTEFFIAPELEDKYSKSQIMEFYVNSNYYGNGCYGIGGAAKYYFGKSPGRLTLAECAMLVGMSNNPSRYNPVINLEQATERRNQVLDIMLNAGDITEEERQQAANETVNLVLEQPEISTESYQTSYAIHCATLKLMELNNFGFQYTFNDDNEYQAYRDRYSNTYTAYSNEIRAGGYTIYTSFSTDLQNSLQYSVDNGLKSFTETDTVSGKYAMQGAAVVIDNSTGYVKAIVGGRGTDDEYNRGFLAERQPGSAIKPIAVYGPAIDTGRYYPSLVMRDTYIEGGPQNSTRTFSGDVTLRYALAKSINTIPFQIISDIKPSTSLEYMSLMRFGTLTPTDNTSALALGGMTHGVRVCDMAKAYYTIQNGGIYTDNICITRLDYEGRGTIFNGEIQKAKVYEPDTAYILTDMLKTVTTDGTGVEVEGHPTGAKTGTTSDERDSWYCGYTKQYTTAVWVGYDTPRQIPNLSRGRYAINIWKDFMDKTHKDLPVLDWERPATVIERNVDSNGNMTDADTGDTDLFSQILIDKLKKEEQDREAEKLRIYEQEWLSQDKNRQQEAETALKAYEDMTCKSVDDIDKIQEAYQNANMLIGLISDNDVKNGYLTRLSNQKSVLDARSVPYEKLRELQKQREKHAEEAREQARQKEIEEQNKELAHKAEMQSAEAAAKEKAEREGEAKAKQELLEKANTALKKLEDYTGHDNTSRELYLAASAAVEACKGYSEYEAYNRRLNAQSSKLYTPSSTVNTEPEPKPGTPEPEEPNEDTETEETEEGEGVE